jgi:glycosyltransferase involved in cell wall biosynthesis
MKVYIRPTAEQVTPETGIGQVVLAQHRGLPDFGVEIVKSPAAADVIATHVAKGGLDHIDVVHSHGIYFSDLPHTPYSNWHLTANREIAVAAREALAITVPSRWVGMPFRRDMRIIPHVIGHGVDSELFVPTGKNRGYILWNKNRGSDVCDPTSALFLAQQGNDVVTTAMLRGHVTPPSMRHIGTMPFDDMRLAIASADIYLATTIETFGIGTLEAMACAVPVLGWNWGGTADIVRHGVDGYLVEPGDYHGLLEGVKYIRQNRKAMGESAREHAERYNWADSIALYASLYEDVLAIKKTEIPSTSVIITCYNYEKWVGSAIQSVLEQTVPAKEIIVIDDGSTDGSAAIIMEMAGKNKTVIPIIKENGGVASARNIGIDRASSEFIVCLDADDMLHPDFIRVLQPAMVADRSLGIAYSGLALMHANGEKTSNNWPPEFKWSIQSNETVPPSNCIPSACMFRKSMWKRAGPVQQIYAPGEDAEFWTRGLSVGFNAKRITDEPLFWYRIHSDSASRTKTYKSIAAWHPWMRDRKYPFGAPAEELPNVNSYALPAVTVIIPVGKGHEKHLPSALQSLLGQTYRNWSVLIVNDTGNYKAMDDLQLGAYPFIEVAQTPTGKLGAGAARNTGIMRATSPLVLFLDADDYLDPSALSNMVTLFSRSEGRYVYTDWIAVGPNGENEIIETNEYDPMRLLMNPESGHSVTVLMLTEQAREILFDEDLESFEDVDFFMRAATKGVHGVRLPFPALYYRTNLGNRRPKNDENKKRLHEHIISRYNGYIGGEIKMASCCGGNADAFLRAKRMISPDYDAKDNEMPRTVVDNVVRMEFIGDTIGAITFRGKEGRAYRGGRNPLNRFCDVHPDDVEHLTVTGRWAVVSTVEKQVESVKDNKQEVELPPPPAADVVTAVDAAKPHEDISDAVVVPAKKTTPVKPRRSTRKKPASTKK